MKYTCSTCGEKISGWPLQRSHMPFERWCSADCLVQFQQQTDEQYDELSQKDIK